MSEQILIIGAGSGIGYGLVQHYLQQGKAVQAISRNVCPDALLQTKVNWLQLDVAAADAAEDAAETAINKIVTQAVTAKPTTIFICHGWLHDNQHGPEKTLRQLTAAQMHKSFAVNVLQPAMYLKALFGYLTKQPQVRVLVLSAKVGSISDNQLGGWYSYRLSKAAVNMLVKTSSIELGRYNKTAVLVSLLRVPALIQLSRTAMLISLLRVLVMMRLSRTAVLISLLRLMPQRNGIHWQMLFQGDR